MTVHLQVHKTIFVSHWEVANSNLATCNYAGNNYNFDLHCQFTVVMMLHYKTFLNLNFELCACEGVSMWPCPTLCCVNLL